MGLHRDGTEYGLGPVETHVRRMIWYQLCFLDIRTCEAQGPRPGIREEEFDTRMPLNVEDSDLESPNPPTESATRWTDMTLSLIRWECVEMHRVVWVDRPRLDKKKISLTAVLGKVENFRRMMREKYLSLIDDSVPVQREGRLLCEVLTLRMHAMVLHKYHNSVTQVIPGECSSICPIYAEILKEIHRPTSSNHHHFRGRYNGGCNRIRDFAGSETVGLVYWGSSAISLWVITSLGNFRISHA